MSRERKKKKARMSREQKKNESSNESRYAFLATIFEYLHELTDTDKSFLDKLIENEIMVTPWPTIDTPNKAQNKKPLELTDVNSEAMSTGFEFLLRFSGTAIPKTFEKVGLQDLEDSRMTFVSILSLANNCIIEQAKKELDNGHSEKVDELENIDISDDFILLLNEVVTGDYLVREIMGDLHASLSLAVSGFYKQALSLVRNILESIVLLTYLIISEGKSKSRWVSGGYGIESFTSMVKEMDKQGVISPTLRDELTTIYWDYLCTATHSHKARMNAVRTDEHDFDLVRFHEFWGILSWCCVTFIKLLSPLGNLCSKVKVNDQYVDPIRAWQELEERVTSSPVGRRADLARQDILYEGKMELETGKTVGVRVALHRVKASKETRFYPVTLFAFPYSSISSNMFVSLRETQGLSIADHLEIIRKRPRIDVGDADDRGMDERVRNLI